MRLKIAVLEGAGRMGPLCPLTSVRALLRKRPDCSPWHGSTPVCSCQRQAHVLWPERFQLQTPKTWPGGFLPIHCQQLSSSHWWRMLAKYHSSPHISWSVVHCVPKPPTGIHFRLPIVVLGRHTSLASYLFLSHSSAPYWYVLATTCASTLVPCLAWRTESAASSKMGW